MTQLENTLEKSIKDILHYDKENAIEKVIKCVFESILQSERHEFLKNSEEQNKGNGYYERLARNINKYFRLRIPRDRLGLFKPVFLEAIRDQESQMQDLAFLLYTKGLTTYDISNIFDQIYDKRLSKSSISNITKEFTEQRECWQNRSLENEYYFIYIDAIWIPVRRDTVEKEAFYIVLGLKKDLKRDILGLYNIPVETADGWRYVLQDLKQRGVEKCLMFIADGLPGLKDIFHDEFPNSKFQRCLVHKKRNVLVKVRSSDKERVAEDLKKVFVLEDSNYTLKNGKENLYNFINKWSKKYRHISNQFDEQEIENYFTYLNFPFSIHRMIYTTNWIERLNKGIRRTQKMRNSFPNPDSALNLIGAYLMDFENRVYKYPVSSFLKVQDELDDLLEKL